MRRHRLFVYGTKDTTETPPRKPYQWRRGGRTRLQALIAAGLGTARPPAPPERRHHDD